MIDAFVFRKSNLLRTLAEIKARVRPPRRTGDCIGLLDFHWRIVMADEAIAPAKLAGFRRG